MDRQNFNADWEWGTPLNPFAAVLGMTGPDTAIARQAVTLPHDALVLSTRSATANTGGLQGYFQAENVEYTKTFDAPEEWRGKAVWLEFEGSYMNTTVFINENFIINWPNGYSTFYARIDGALDFGTQNQLRVLVRNGMQSNSRWYAGGGLYRDVHLIVGGPTRIALDGVRVTTVDADPDLAVINVDVTVEQERTARTGVRVVSTIVDANGGEVASRTAKLTLVNADTRTVRQRIDFANPQLWNVGEGNLYTCRTRLETLDGHELDTQTVTFGVRVLQVDAFRGLRINGRPVKLKGGCIHHDNGVIGAATFATAEDRRVRRLQEAGYNALRSAHNPTSRALLEACDRHGVLVMDEFADTWHKSGEGTDLDYGLYLSEYWERDLERMIARDYNHPSVIMYSIGNEILDIGLDVADMWGETFIRKVRELDPTRYITQGLQPFMMLINQLLTTRQDLPEQTDAAAGDTREVDVNSVIQNFDEATLMQMVNAPFITDRSEQSADLLDIVGWNYAEARYEPDHERYPHRVVVGTENRPQMLAENWRIVERNAYVLGDFSWTAWDYMGEVGAGRLIYEPEEPGSGGFTASWPWIAFGGADFDLIGDRRPRSFWREIIWGGRDHSPYIAVENPAVFGKTPTFRGLYSWPDVHHNWTWSAHTGDQVRVEVYSDADEVELLLNGDSLGRRPVGADGRDYVAEFVTSYAPGTLEAVAYIGDSEVGRDTLATAGPTRIALTAETTALRVGSNDLAYVTVGFVDADGVPDLSVHVPVRFTITGPAFLQGSGSADPATTEQYYDPEHLSYWGRALAVIRAEREAGTATLTVSAEGFADATVEIEIIG